MSAPLEPLPAPDPPKDPKMGDEAPDPPAETEEDE